MQSVLSDESTTLDMIIKPTLSWMAFALSALQTACRQVDRRSLVDEDVSWTHGPDNNDQSASTICFLAIRTEAVGIQF